MKRNHLMFVVLLRKLEDAGKIQKEEQIIEEQKEVAEELKNQSRRMDEEYSISYAADYQV